MSLRGVTEADKMRARWMYLLPISVYRAGGKLGEDHARRLYNIKLAEQLESFRKEKGSDV